MTAIYIRSYLGWDLGVGSIHVPTYHGVWLVRTKKFYVDLGMIEHDNFGRKCNVKAFNYYYTVVLVNPTLKLKIHYTST